MNRFPAISTESGLALALFKEAEKRLAARDLGAAIRLYSEAESAGYDRDRCSGARWICHMLTGDYGRAWLESDAIFERGRPDPNRFWNRRPLDGKRVLVRCLHGLGDTLQYVRYLPLLRNSAAKVSLETQPQLKELLVQARVADQVITWGEPEPQWDEQIEVVELPLIFRSTVETLPAPAPYISFQKFVGARRDTLPRIGLLWASSNFNPERSIPLSLLSSICKPEKMEFFSFQTEPARGELLRRSYAIRDYSSPNGDVFETAQRLSSMDLVITVDTMLAHLAGALGRPVWLLLPFAADWRWMLDRRDSPWYPTMRLFRQPRPGDWEAVVECVRKELRERCGQGW